MMKKTMKSCFCGLRAAGLSLAFAVAASAASARTVAWWRFADLGDNPGQTSPGQTFTNSVDASAHPAYAASFKNAAASDAGAAWYPSTTNAFADVRRVRLHDPVSDEYHSLASALHCPWGGNESGVSGGAYVNYDPALIGQGEGGTGAFTYECIFRTTEEGLNRTWSMEPLVGQKSHDWSGAWSLIIHQKKIWTRCTITNTVDTTATPAQDAAQGFTLVTPNVWHHAAFVFDPSNSPHVRIYLDYKRETTIAKSVEGGRAWFPKVDLNEKIYIGKGRYLDDRSFNGEIAEVRVSDKALYAEDFMRLESYADGDRGSDDDTDLIGWYSLDNADSFQPNPFFAVNASLANVGSYHASLAGEKGEAGFNESAIDPQIRVSFTGDVYRANGGSLAVRTNGTAATVADIDNKHVKIADTNGRILNGDLTQEFFFRTFGEITPSHPQHWGIASAEWMKLLILKDEGANCGKLLVRIRKRGGGDFDCDYGKTSRVDDGKWHHVAIVQNYAAQTVSVYLDYVCLSTISDLLRQGVSTSTTTQPWCFGSAREYTPPQHFNGCVDEIRLTRRALKPNEFMGYGVLGDTLLHLRFEDDTSPYPYPSRPLTFEFQHASETGMGAFPWYTNDVKRPAVDLRDNSKQPVVDNTRALAFAGGRASMRETPIVSRSDITIECLYKSLGRGAPWVNVFSLVPTYGQEASEGISIERGWALSYSSDWKTINLRFWAEFTVDGKRAEHQVTASPTWTFTDLSHKDDAVGYGTITADGRWHHVAITLGEFEEGGVTKTRMTSYWDYKVVQSKVINGTLRLPIDTGFVQFGRSGYTKRFADFEIDEFRVSKGVLDPDRFLHDPRLGLYLMLK